MKNSEAGTNFVEYGNDDIFFFVKCFLYFALPITLFDAFYKGRNICRYSFISSLIAFSTMMVMRENNTLTYFVFFVVIMISLYCFNFKVKPTLIQKEMKQKDTVTIITVISLSVVFIVCTFSALRYYCYSAPNYDFGIFCNMF